MIKIRSSGERGFADHGWLKTFHTFSFADYHDPQQMGFRSLRVINDDRVGPGSGFPAHPHRDMEILSYVVEGALEHRDNMGNGSVIRPGDVQRISAGSGITHSEFNPSDDEPVRFLQVWILPRRRGGMPGWEQKHFAEDGRRDRLQLVASPDGREGSVGVDQDVAVYASRMARGARATLELAPGRHAWIQVVSGGVVVAGRTLVEGDGAAVSDEQSLELVSPAEGHFLIFDLA